MHDHRSPNGSTNWHDPFTVSILLGLKEDMGRVKEAMHRSLSNDRELFDSMRDIRDRVAHLEASRSLSAGPPPTDIAGSRTSAILSWIKDVLPPVKEILAAIVVIAVALGWVAPQQDAKLPVSITVEP